MSHRFYLLLLVFPLLTLALWSCGAPADEEILQTYPTGEVQEVVRYTGQGSERQIAARVGYYRNGRKSSEELFHNGQVTSYQAWWPNEQLRTVREYAAGRMIRTQHYDADGARLLPSDEIKALLTRLKAYPGQPATDNDIVTMETSAGILTLRLFPHVAPGHCGNFKRLANFGFYDSTTFHRVIPGFVIQGGDIYSRDPLKANDGGGHPGYVIDAEFNPMPHQRGTLAMARGDDPNSASSQFYICLDRRPDLDNRYTVFGELIGGFDVLERIGQAPTDDRDNPLIPQRILKVRVTLAR